MNHSPYCEPFTIKLKGWGSFDHGYSITVYIDVEHPEPIMHLMNLIKSPSKSPHISLAKKIPREAFDKLAPYLENLDYSAGWICTEVTVLRKLMSEKHLGFRESVKIPLAE